MPDSYWILSAAPLTDDQYDLDALPEPLRLDLPAQQPGQAASWLQLALRRAGESAADCAPAGTPRAGFTLDGLDRAAISGLQRRPVADLLTGKHADQDRLLVLQFTATQPSSANCLHPATQPGIIARHLEPRRPDLASAPLVLPGIGFGDATHTLPYIEQLPVAYNVASGHDFWSDLPLLWFDAPRARAVRLHLYRVLNTMLRERVAAPLHDWCQEHGLQLTGMDEGEPDLSDLIAHYAGPDILLGTTAVPEGDGDAYTPAILVLDPTEAASAELRRDLRPTDATEPTPALAAIDACLHAVLHATLHDTYAVAFGLERDIDAAGDALEAHYIIGSARYPIVILPEAETWRHKTLCYIEHFVKQGGHLILCGQEPTEVDCRDAVDRWRAALAFPSVHRLPADAAGIRPLLAQLGN